MNNKIGVVTVTYNSTDVLDDFLESMKNQTHQNYVLYVIDNASHDSTAQIIQALHDPHIVYIQNEENAGVAVGNNQGTVKAIEDCCNFILFLNNDTSFEPYLFDKLLKGLEEHKADIVVPKIYYSDNKTILWFAGGDFDKLFQCDVNHIGFKEEDKG